MDQTQFSGFVKYVAAVFEQKPPRDDSFQAWWLALQDIPATAIPAVREKFVLMESWPRNFVKVFWALYYQVKDENPALTGPVVCECNEGYLKTSEKRGYWEVAKKEGDQWGIYHFKCACQQGPVRLRKDLWRNDLYEQAPVRYQTKPVPYQFILPDEEGMAWVREGFRRVIRERKSRRLRPTIENRVTAMQSAIDIDDLPF